jgi:protein-disulfide isomerase
MPQPKSQRRYFLRQIMSTSAASVMAPLLASPLFSSRAMAAELDLETALSPRIFGNADAPIHVVEYFSMTCGHCANFHVTTYPEVKKNWIDTGKVRFEYRDFPLSELSVYGHALARAIPEAGYEAMLDLLLGRQAEWASDPQPLLALQKIGRVAGINEDEFTAMLTNRSFLEGIVAIAQKGYDEYAIDSTPTFIINGTEVVKGYRPYEEFSALLTATST